MQPTSGSEKSNAKTEKGNTKAAEAKRRSDDPQRKKVDPEIPKTATTTPQDSTEQAKPKGPVTGKQAAGGNAYEPGIGGGMSVFPQGFHDVVEVLCAGETTAGKLLMHFLLFYGQHFDSQSTAIDYSGTHPRDVNRNNGYSQFSPYMQRRTAGTYDPVTGMLTVDPIVVYDPLEGAENNNAGTYMLPTIT